MSAAENRRPAGRTSPAPRWRLTLCATAAVLWLAGCAAQRLHDEGMSQIEKGQARQGVDNLRQASEMEPANARFRIDYLNQREFQVQRQLHTAEQLWQAGRLDETQQRLREVLQMEPANERAVRSLVAVEARRRADTQVQQAEKQAAAGHLDQARETLKLVLRDQPQHAQAKADLRTVEERIAADRAAREEKLGNRAALRKPVTLQFRDAALRLVFEAISRATNINIIVDRDVRSDLRSTIFVKDAAVEDAIDLILLQNQLDKRVLNSNTLLVYPATAAKQKELGELRVRTFQLSNIDAAHMANIIKTMLKTKDVVTDVRTNTLIMRDTPEAIAVAEQLVTANDVAEPEVMLEVEVLEVTMSRNSEIGIKWPTGITFTTPNTPILDANGLPTSGTSPLTWGTIRNTSAAKLLVPQLSAALNLQLTDSDTNILASPRIRVRNKEKAKIMVGDKVPVITNVLASAQTAAGGGTAGAAASNNFITGSIQYLDVGLKLEVEPQVYAEGDVAIKINLDVSSVTKEVSTQSGTAYQIGTRNAQTVLRLKDGETQVMAGLIRNEDSNAAAKVPGLGQFPVLGHLFRNDKDSRTKTEIVLSITPRIIRPLAVNDMSRADVFAGSDGAVRSRPLRVEPIETLRVGGATSGQGGATPVTQPAPAPLPAPARPASAPEPAPAPAQTGASAPAGAASAPAAATKPVVPAQTPAPAPAAAPQAAPSPAAAAVRPAAAAPTAVPKVGASLNPPAVIVPTVPAPAPGAAPGTAAVAPAGAASQPAPQRPAPAPAMAAPPGAGGIAPIQPGIPGLPAAMPRNMPGRKPFAPPAPPPSAPAPEPEPPADEPADEPANEQPADPPSGQ